MGRQVLFHFPGLQRAARHHSSASPSAEVLRSDMRASVPGLATADGWRTVRTLIIPFEANPNP